MINLTTQLHAAMAALRSSARRAFAPLAIGAAMALVVACGGGVGSGGTGSFASGPITGYGSIVVNGVHYDESRAEVLDEEDGRYDRNALRLGMTVEIEAGRVTPASGTEPARAVAVRVRVGSELVGPIDEVNVAAATLVVAGQSVRLTDATLVDDHIVGGLAGLSLGEVVEVYGFLDPAGAGYVATRLERADARGYKVRGVVAQLDIQAGSFSIDGQRYVLATGVAVPAGLANGDFVRVQLRSARDNQGRWVVEGFGRALPHLDDQDDVKLKGPVTRLDSPTRFAVNGVPVDATNAQVSGTLALGTRVEVEGASVNGVLVARSVQLDDDVPGAFELRGRIATLDTTAKAFTLQGRQEVVGYGAASVEFKEGTEADLQPGVEVDVKGALSADRTRVEAREIKFRD